MIVWARNAISKQVEGFIVDSRAQGIQTSVIQRKLAFRIVQNADIVFRDVFVPDSDRFEKAKSFSQGVNLVLGSSRVYVPWIAIGIMGGAYEAAMKYCSSRRQFEAPLTSNQLVQEKLVRILGYFTAAFLQGWRLITMEKCDISQSSSVKSWATLIGRELTKLAREVVGGNGILIDNYVMKAMLDMEALYTYEGSYEMNALITGRSILGIAAFKPSYKL